MPVMSGLQRWVLAAAVGCQGCAIIALVGENRDAALVGENRDAALVGENRDAGFDAAEEDVSGPPSDQVAPPMDTPPLFDSGSSTDLGTFTQPDPLAIRDAQAGERPTASGAGQDVVDAARGEDTGDDVVVRADTSATADAGMTMVADGAALEDASQLLPDVMGGAACRRDSDCTRDPAGMLCGMMTMRCGTVR